MNRCSCGNLKDKKYIMCTDCYNKKLVNEKIDKWVNSLRTYWTNKDIEKIVALFSEDCECYDTPFSAKGNVKEDWKEIETQNIIDITYKILMRNTYEFIVEFTIQYDDGLCSAVNHIKLNKDLKCTYLKQWFMDKE